MAIYLPDTSGLAQGIGAAGGALAEALNKRYELNKQKELRDILSSTIRDANFSSEAGQQSFLNKYLMAGGNPKDATAIIKQMKPSGLESWLGTDVPNDPAEMKDTLDTLNQVLANKSDNEIMAGVISEDAEVRRAAEYESNRREASKKQNLAERKFQAEQGKDFRKRISNLRESIPKKQLAINSMRQAVESGEMGPASWANIARITGIDELQSVSGGQGDIAAKTFLVSNLGDVSARAQNLWMERIIRSAFASPGKGKEVNLAQIDLTEANLKLDNIDMMLADRISQEDREKYGYVIEETLEERIAKEAAPLKQKVMEDVSYSTRVLYEDEKGDGWIVENIGKKVPSGTPITKKTMAALRHNYNNDSKKALKNAEKLGYSIPTIEQMRERWQ